MLLYIVTKINIILIHCSLNKKHFISIQNFKFDNNLDKYYH